MGHVTCHGWVRRVNTVGKSASTRRVYLALWAQSILFEFEEPADCSAFFSAAGTRSLVDGHIDLTGVISVRAVGREGGVELVGMKKRRWLIVPEENSWLWLETLRSTVSDTNAALLEVTQDPEFANPVQIVTPRRVRYSGQDMLDALHAWRYDPDSLGAEDWQKVEQLVQLEPELFRTDIHVNHLPVATAKGVAHQMQQQQQQQQQQRSPGSAFFGGGTSGLGTSVLGRVTAGHFDAAGGGAKVYAALWNDAVLYLFAGLGSLNAREVCQRFFTKSGDAGLVLEWVDMDEVFAVRPVLVGGLDDIIGRPRRCIELVGRSDGGRDEGGDDDDDEIEDGGAEFFSPPRSWTFCAAEEDGGPLVHGKWLELFQGAVGRRNAQLYKAVMTQGWHQGGDAELVNPVDEVDPDLFAGPTTELLGVLRRWKQNPTRLSDAERAQIKICRHYPGIVRRDVLFDASLSTVSSLLISGASIAEDENSQELSMSSSGRGAALATILPDADSDGDSDAGCDDGDGKAGNKHTSGCHWSPTSPAFVAPCDGGPGAGP
eukprot:g3911.t1